MKRAGIVLCGGLSRRMGRPKALLPWFGRSMIEHVVSLLEGRVDERIVVTSEALSLSLSSLSLDARIVVDRDPARGPLAALRDGLAASGAELAFVTSCDVPFLTGDHVDRLFATACAGREARAVAPLADGFVQVLSAVYPVGAWRVAADLLADGTSGPSALIDRIGYQPLERVPSPSGEFAPWSGFNTPDAYLALARRRDPAASAMVEWEGMRRTVEIGGLAEILERTAPVAASANRVQFDRLAQGELRVFVAEGQLVPGVDPGLPIGPGETVRVFEAPHGDPRARVTGSEMHAERAGPVDEVDQRGGTK